MITVFSWTGHNKLDCDNICYGYGAEPMVQTQAQKEINAVTGGKRLPNFDDWKALPIVERIVYETLRLVRISIISWKRADRLADFTPLSRIVNLVSYNYLELTKLIA